MQSIPLTTVNKQTQAQKKACYNTNIIISISIFCNILTNVLAKLFFVRFTISQLAHLVLPTHSQLLQQRPSFGKKKCVEWTIHANHPTTQIHANHLPQAHCVIHDSPTEVANHDGQAPTRQMVIQMYKANGRSNVLCNNNNNKRPLTPKSMPPAGDEHAKLKT